MAVVGWQSVCLNQRLRRRGAESNQGSKPSIRIRTADWHVRAAARIILAVSWASLVRRPSGGPWPPFPAGAVCWRATFPGSCPPWRRASLHRHAGPRSRFSVAARHPRLTRLSWQNRRRGSSWVGIHGPRSASFRSDACADTPNATISGQPHVAPSFLSRCGNPARTPTQFGLLCHCRAFMLKNRISK